MKTFNRPCILALVFALLSCTKEPRENGGLVRHSLTAGIEGATKTQLKEDDATKVLWSAREGVTVWVDGSAYSFSGTNTSAAASTTFEGDAPQHLGTWVLVSPHGASSAIHSGTVTATLPAEQSAVAGGFDPSAALLSGLGSGTSVTCRHLYSGIRFQLSQSGVRSVSLSGNNGEKIAGEFTFRLTAESPVISEGTSRTIVLHAPAGGTFATGVWYYILCLPATFTQGITLTADNGTQVGNYTTLTATDFSRTKIKNMTGNLDERMLWGNVQVYYGPANSFSLRPGEITSFDVGPRKIYGSWQRSGIAASADEPDGVQTLWGDSTASLSGTTLSVTAASAEGSSLIAVKKGETTLWSYLIWVTATAPAETTIPGGAVILPPLGGNCYFQWGRKDPLLSGTSRAANQGADGLSYSISHPLEYIMGPGSPYDWFGNVQDVTLWGDGGEKTVWDPCPDGYRVPSESNFSAIDFTYLENNFPALGYVHDSGYYPTMRTYWTRTVSDKFSTALDDSDYPQIFYGQNRKIASPVRCIKE